ncbi:hypothetical protein UFOVP535_43 [uncultured Caudovirales phage]|uniref:Uncharacterized protein n=1 Tax=uncultured Caudovirales phage TaxID=2100421 RepID=A0A6J5MRH1_9CAUD|nr:hypothetical protein UFOVP535_43 [uncultured Caudovirales phage]
MAKFKFILTVIIILCTITSYAQPAQYTPMTASGYQMKRLKVDSTLHLPSFCGVPNLRGSLAKEGSLAIDTCGALLYMWTNTAGWDTVNVSGGGGSSTDTTSLSNRINLKIDSIRRVSDSVFAWINGVSYFQFKDSVGGGGGDFWKTSGITTLTDDVYIQSDSIIAFTGKEDEMRNFAVNSQQVNLYTTTGIITLFGLNTTTDTSTYKPLGIDNSTGKIAPLTSWVSGGTTIDTTNQFVKRLDRTPGKDSIIYFVGANRFAIKDSVGTGGSTQNGRFGNDTATIVMVKVHNDAGVTLTNGKVVALTTSGNNNEAPAVRLANNKGDSTSANTLGFVSGTIANQDTGWVILSGKIEKLNTSAFSNGDIIYLDSVNGNWTKTKPQAPYHMVYLGVVVKSNSGNGSIFVKAQNGYELDEIHDVKITSPLNNQVLAYSDTQRIWKNRNIYTIVDTTSLSNRINLKQNSSLTSYSFLANNTSATANATVQYFKDTSGTYTSAIGWNGTAPTSGNLTYRWTRIGKMVIINISLVYANAGSANSTLTVALPSDAPTPSKPAGLTSALNNLYPILGSVNITNQSTLTNSGTRGFLRNNTANNGFEFNLAYTATTAVNAFITCTYYTD